MELNPQLHRSTSTTGGASGVEAVVGPGFAPVIGTIKGKLLLACSTLFFFSWVSKAALPKNCTPAAAGFSLRICTSIGKGTGFYTFITASSWLVCVTLLLLLVFKGEVVVAADCFAKTSVNYWVLELGLVASFGFTTFCTACNTSIWTSAYAGAGSGVGFMKFGIACAFFGAFSMAVLSYIAFQKLKANPTVVTANANANPEHAFRGGAEPVAELYVAPPVEGGGPGMVYPPVGAGAGAGHPGVDDVPPPSYEAFADDEVKAPPSRPSGQPTGRPASGPPPKPAARPGPAPGVYGI